MVQDENSNAFKAFAHAFKQYKRSHHQYEFVIDCDPGILGPLSQDEFPNQSAEYYKIQKIPDIQAELGQLKPFF